MTVIVAPSSASSGPKRRLRPSSTTSIRPALTWRRTWLTAVRESASFMAFGPIASAGYVKSLVQPAGEHKPRRVAEEERGPPPFPELTPYGGEDPASGGAASMSLPCSGQK